MAEGNREQRREAYRQKLLDPRWQKLRLQILERDEWKCQICFDGENTLHVHHRWYEGKNPWDAPLEALVTLCEYCHSNESHDRPLMEQMLLQVLRKWGFASDVLDLAYAVTDTPFPLVFDAACGVLTDRDLYDRIEPILAEWRAERRKRFDTFRAGNGSDSNHQT